MSSSEREMLYDFLMIANREFLSENISLFEQEVSEQCFCGALMLQMDLLKRQSDVWNPINTKYQTSLDLSNYYVDVEYNRNIGNVNTEYCNKSILKPNGGILNITCDIIMHSRGENVKKDNLIAIEMKKETNPASVEKDKERLRILTSQNYCGEDQKLIGINFPKYVCRYYLGVYYQIDKNFESVTLSFYKEGNHIKGLNQTIFIKNAKRYVPINLK